MSPGKTMSVGGGSDGSEGLWNTHCDSDLRNFMNLFVLGGGEIWTRVGRNFQCFENQV